MEIRLLEPDEARRRAIPRSHPRGRPDVLQGGRRRCPTRRAWSGPGRRGSSRSRAATVVGYVAVVPLTGWSSHVGELRVIVDPEHRGRGIGKALTRRAMLEALELGLTKMVIEVIADQESRVEMFRALGFVPEALLTDHVRDQSGSCTT